MSTATLSPSVETTRLRFVSTMRERFGGENEQWEAAWDVLRLVFSKDVADTDLWGRMSESAMALVLRTKYPKAADVQPEQELTYDDGHADGYEDGYAAGMKADA